MERPRCLVTVDLEEWSDAALAGIPLELRMGLPKNLESPVDALLELLDAASARATFFVLGRVARRYPSLVRRIASRHEIASHGDTHVAIDTLDADGLRREVLASKQAIEDVVGTQVVGFRAPNFSLAGCVPWAAPILAESGIVFDSSLIPGSGIAFLRGAGRVPSVPFPLTADGSLWEFPPTIARCPGASVPIAGGAFLRALPSAVALHALHAASGRGEEPVLHVHPWEMPPAPVARIARWRRIALFSGARSIPAKLSRILAEFRGRSVGEAWAELSA